jgi:hypothetical protein
METCLKRLLPLPPPLLLLLTLPAALQAQFNYSTSNGTITITRYTGSGGAVTIPSMTNGLPVTCIGDLAFTDSYGVTSVTVPNSVISIGDGAFWTCTNLTSVTISNGVTSIGNYAFEGCTSLPSVTIPASDTNVGDAMFVECSSLTAITVDALNSIYSSVDGVLFNNSQTTLVEYPGGKAGNYTVPDSVTSIGEYAFSFCASLTNVTIGTTVTSIGDEAFEFCTSLTGVYFKGNVPSVGSGVFDADNNATVYYLPGATGWGPMIGSLRTALWFLPNPLILNNGASFGVQTNGFGFIISWATNIPVVVEACTNLANHTWSPVGTNNLTGGSSYFSDPQWTNYPARFYRLRSP